jgi:hypothetical protein
MPVEKILESSTVSSLLIERRENSDFVIGVPHHAPLGTPNLPCPEHEDSDENTGHLGRYLAFLLGCHSVIACNYMMDVNKSRDSDYFKVLSAWSPTALVEIHGHGGEWAIFDIEISCGSIDHESWAMQLAEVLENKLAPIPTLAPYSISGAFEAIYYKATKSVTITTDEWLAFHIELPKALRSSKSQYLPFCESLAESLREILERYRKEDVNEQR